MALSKESTSEMIQKCNRRPFGIRVTIDDEFTHLQWLDFINDNVESIQELQRAYLFVLIQPQQYVPYGGHYSKLHHSSKIRGWRHVRPAENIGTFVGHPRKIADEKGKITRGHPAIYFHEWQGGDALMFGNGVVHGSEIDLGRRLPGHTHPWYKSTAIVCASTTRKYRSLYRAFFTPEDEDVRQHHFSGLEMYDDPHFWTDVRKILKEQREALKKR